MTAPGKRLSIDFETASVADLKRMGAELYSRHPTTRVLCMAYAFDNDPVQVWDPRAAQFPDDVRDHVANGGIVTAWNAAFELAIWNHVLNRRVPSAPVFHHEQARCTMARAAFYGLPLSLDLAGKALRLPFQKNAAGHSLMLRMCRPRSIAPDGVPIWWHETDPQKYQELMAYCQQDVVVERAVAKCLPDLTVDEQRVWEIDYRMNNLTGVYVDFDLIDKLEAMANRAKAAGNARLAELTQNQVTSVSQTARLLPFLQALGYPHGDLTKASVAERLDDPDCGELETEILEIRADVAKTSAAKLAAMRSAASPGDGQVRGMLQYYGAFRTGRWAGRLIQLQNMPRGELPKGTTDAAVAMVLNGVPDEIISALLGVAPMRVVSSLLRSCIVAPPGFSLVAADLAQIEARVIAWLAGQDDLLQVFASGQDVYCYTATKVTGQTVTKNDPLRQFGKVLVLACGFGMGGSKFAATAKTYGITLTDAEGDSAVKSWRLANPEIVNFWYALDAAVRDTLTTGATSTVGPLTIGLWDDTLVIRLPSGRPLCYREAKLIPDPNGPVGRQSISYMGLNQYTRKWERLRTYGGKLAENVTQAVARDVMAHAMQVLAQGYSSSVQPMLTVHDELIVMAPDHAADAAKVILTKVMKTPPPWAQGLPLDADAWIGKRYKK